MIDLEKLEPSVVKKGIGGKHWILSGDPKAGKTTFAASIPRALILAFEPGASFIQGAYVAPIKTWSEFKSYLIQLSKPSLKERFDTVVFDTLSVAWQLAEKYAISNKVDKAGDPAKSAADVPWGKGYKDMTFEFTSAIYQLAADGYGMGFICHSKREETGTDDNKKVEIIADIPTRLQTTLNGLCDLQMMARITGNPNDGYTHELITRDYQGYKAGNRVAGLPTVIPLNYKVFAKILDDTVESLGAIEDTGEKPPYELVDLTYEEAMERARTLYGEKIQGNADNAMALQAYLGTLFSPIIPISQIQEKDVDRLRLVVQELERY